MDQGQRWIGCAGLDPAHVRPEYTHSLGELFLIEFTLGAQLFEALAEALAVV
jgi:hypothetical protein